AIGIEADKHEPAPGGGAHRRQGHILGSHGGATLPVLGIQNADVVAVQIPLPGVETAVELVDAAAPLQQFTAAVGTDVVEGANGVVAIPHQDDGLVGDVVHTVVAGGGNVLLPAGHLPYPVPQFALFQLGEFPGDIALLGNEIIAQLEQPVRYLNTARHL